MTASKRRGPRRRRRGPKQTGGVRLRRSRHGDAWVLVHPPCAARRAEDLEEVHAMIAGGAWEVAVDELRWLLEGCSDFLAAHTLLGELALREAADVPLARGHFGYAYQLGLAAIRRAGQPAPIPYRFVDNRPFFHAGRGLSECLDRLDLVSLAIEVLEQLLRCDPTDPLDLAPQLAALRIKGSGDRA